jgi:hypothetical protein
MNKQAICPGCKALVKDIPGKPHKYIGAAAGCWEIYGQILAKEYGEYAYPQLVHGLTVDTYAVQHPGTPGRQSIQSVNLHLARLYLTLELELGWQEVKVATKRILDNAERFVWLTPPELNGTTTVLHMAEAGDFDEHQRLVERWARDVWRSWATHHPRIKDLARPYV